MKSELLVGNCMELITRQEPGTFHCVVTDPAYWTLNKWREVGTTTRLGGHHDATQRDDTRWFKTIDSDDLWSLMIEIQLRLPKDAHCWLMCDFETLKYVQGYADEAGYNYCKPFPCVKMTQDGNGIRQGMGYHGRASHEYVVLLEKGRRRFTDENWPDVFMFPWTGDRETRPFTEDGKPYPTAKPVALMRRLIQLSTEPGEVVLDPFLGSGTTAVAAQDLQRGFIGWDTNPAAIEITQRRLTAVTAQPALEIA